VLGQTCPPACGNTGCCSQSFIDECTVEHGWFFSEDCSFGGSCGTVCNPPTPTGKFECGSNECDAGQVCLYTQLCGDGCTNHQCAAPPTACAGAPSCTCLKANQTTWMPGLAWIDCGWDTAGNATVTICP